MKPTLTWILIWLSAFPSFGVIPSPSKTVGLYWIGAKQAFEGVNGFELQKELSRWVENRPDFSLQVKQGTAELLPDSIETEKSRWHLKKIAAGLLTASFSTKEAWESFLREEKTANSLLSDIAALRAKLNRSEDGDVLQQAWISEAAYYWRSGQESKMGEAMTNAIRLHPEGIVNAHWESIDSGLADVFQMKLETAKEKFQRSCKLSFPASISQSSIRGNGFEMGTTRELQVISGRHAFRLLTSKGQWGPVNWVECHRPGAQTVVLAPPSSPTAAPRLNQALGSLDAALLIRPGKESGQVYLYSDEGVDELGKIPLSQDSKSGADSWKKLFSQNWEKLANKHRLASNELSEVSMGDLMVSSADADDSYDSPIVDGEIAESVAGDRWYNNWKFWAVAGTLLAGGAAVFLLSRDGNVKESGNVTIQKP